MNKSRQLKSSLKELIKSKVLSNNEKFKLLEELESEISKEKMRIIESSVSCCSCKALVEVKRISTLATTPETYKSEVSYRYDLWGDVIEERVNLYSVYNVICPYCGGILLEKKKLLKSEEVRGNG